MDEPANLSLKQLGKGLSERRLRARAVTESALERMRGDAYVHVDREQTLKEADAADAALDAGHDLGPLLGIPVSVKDLYGVPGYPTLAGSSRRLPKRFEVPGPIVSKIRSQLGVIMGKTHTVEFAFGGIGTNPHHPTPINPWDATAHRAPGGSSAGAGVSLSEGSAFLALGTDTAGSVRIPASWTGNVGLKTTKGRWSTKGIVPLSTTLDTPGVLVRTVEDLIVAFGALDPAGVPRLPFLATSDIRMGRCDDVLFEDCSPGVVEAVDRALSELTAKGARLLPMEIPELRPTRELFHQGGPVSSELYHFLKSELPEWFDALDPNVRARVQNAVNIPAPEYVARRAAMERLAQAVDERLRAVDVLVSPTVANTPPLLSSIEEAEDYGRENLLCLRNTCVVSYLGLCALTLPIGLDRARMPVGLQLVARAGAESRLLAIARLFEEALGTGLGRLGPPPRTRD